MVHTFNCPVHYVRMFISLNSISIAKQINCSHKRNDVCTKCKLMYLENIDFNILYFIEDTVLPSSLLFIFKNKYKNSGLHFNCPAHYVFLFIILNIISSAKQINCSHKRNDVCTKCKLMYLENIDFNILPFIEDTVLPNIDCFESPKNLLKSLYTTLMILPSYDIQRNVFFILKKGLSIFCGELTKDYTL